MHSSSGPAWRRLVCLFLLSLLLAAGIPNIPFVPSKPAFQVSPLLPAGARMPAGGSPAGAPAQVSQGQVVSTTSILPGSFDGDIRDLPPVPSAEGEHEANLQEPSFNKLLNRTLSPAAPEYDAPVTPNLPVPLVNFAGLGKADSCTGGTCGAGWPPDTVGDVGPNHYVQAVNTSFAVYSKTGSRIAATTFNSLWSADSSATPCKNQNRGDPTVVFDPIGDRWLVADFAFAVDNNGYIIPPSYECIAVSKSGDPVSGGWWLYPINIASMALNDYPKMGLWPDGIYLSYNMFDLTGGTSYSFSGAKVQALNRSDLESGAAVRMQSFDLSSSYYSILPANLRGTPPPAGSAAYFVTEDLKAYYWDVFKFSANWTDPNLSAWTGPTKVSQASYSSPGSNAVIPQKSSAYRLDSLGDRLMMQAQYRKIGSQESIWVVHTVAPASNGQTALQWAEIDVTGGTIASTPKQQQIFTNGNDGLYRWVPSIAVDKMGNALVGYSAGNANNDPSIRLAGRVVTDAAGTLGQGELAIYGGTAAQNISRSGSPITRWGDYSAMTVDPADDCTFWYTNEYYAVTAPAAGGESWQTRIASLRFQNCTAARMIYLPLIRK